MRHRILVVEDSPTQAEALRSHLTEAGYECHMATSGLEGLEKLEGGRFDLVLSDIVMPGEVDGYELCRRVKAQWKEELPVILLTALSDPMDIINGLVSGADNFLRKPCEPEVLLDRISGLLTTRKVRRAERVSVGVKVLFMGEEFTITSAREQILDMLITSFEEAVSQNRQLRKREEELTRARAELARYTQSLEARLEHVLSSIPDALFSVSPDWREWRYVSQGALGVLGRAPSSITAEYIRDRIHSEDRERVEAEAERGLRSGEPWETLLRFRRDGSYRWLTGTLVPVRGEDGVVERVDGIVRDITERVEAERQLRASEEKFSLLFHASPVAKGIIRLSDRMMVEVNRAFEEYTGWRVEEAVGHTLDELGLWPEQELRAVLRQVLLEEEKITNREMTFRTRAGEDRAGLLSVEMLGMNSEPHALWLVSDVTELRTLESQLRQAQKMEAIGQLTGGIAHDFNNLLTVIVSGVELLEDPDEQGWKEDLESVKAAAERGAGLVRKLLAFSRRGELNLEAVCAQTLVRDLTRTLERFLPDDIEIRLEAEGSSHGMMDPGAVEQILLNLATNARDAMKGGGTLTIALEDVEMDEESCAAHGWGEPGSYVRITVTDTGCGMDRRTLNKVYEPFFTTKPEGKGTGLGMAVTYGLVKQHGGFINVYSELGKGTEVKVYFLATDEPATLKARPREGPMRGGTETILVVEDDEGIRNITERVLQARGYMVLTVPDGIEALRVLRSGDLDVDLVVSDVVMPRLGGVALFRELERAGEHARFLFTSGYTGDELDADRGPPGWKDHFLSKPWTILDLLQKVREILDEEGPAGT